MVNQNKTVKLSGLSSRPLEDRDRSHSSRSLFGSLLCCLAILILFVGCAGPYLIRQAAGQVRLLASIEPRSLVSASSIADAQQNQRLQEIDSILQFAADQGLSVDGAYNTYVDLGRKAAVYVVSACPDDSLKRVTWQFPVVGEFPYKGFFDLAAALRLKESLEQQKFEVHLGGSSAYSTLGFFDDPVFSSFLRESSAGLSDLLLHELLHRTFFIKGDVGFNEKLATFVGRKLTIKYLEKRYGKNCYESRRYQARYRDRKLLGSALRVTLGELSRGFEASSREQRLENKKNALSALTAKLNSLKFELPSSNYFATITWTLPQILSFDLYDGEHQPLEDAWTDSGQNCTIFLKLLENLKPGPYAMLRLKQYLSQLKKSH